jgi:hypothetical protein
VAGPDPDLELILARWVLGELAPEDVPALATDALVRGCESTAIAVLAGLRRPTRLEVEDELPAVLRAVGRYLPPWWRAVEVCVNVWAHEIATGRLPPYDGAEQILSACRSWSVEHEVRDQLAELEGLVFEWEQPWLKKGRWRRRRSASTIESQIVAAANALIAAGGLQIPHQSDDTVR